MTFSKKVILLIQIYKEEKEMPLLNVRKRNNTWEYYFEGAKIGGKRYRPREGGFRTKAEASAAGNAALAKYYSTGSHFTPTKISFSDLLDTWIKEYGEVNLKEVTLTNYRKRIRIHIKPELGMYQAASLTPIILQEFINKKAKQNYSRNTLSVIKGILSSSFTYAVLMGMVPSSPMINVKLPSPRNERIKSRTDPHIFITPDKIEMIFGRFPEKSSTHVAMMSGYKGGLRLGEAFALAWDDVDFVNNTISVNKQIQWSETEKVWYFSDPKYDSFRVIKMDKDYMALLTREKERQKKAKIYFENDYVKLYMNQQKQLNTDEDGNLIQLINVRENGEFIIPRSMQHTSSILHHKMDFPDFDFHSFRHTHATMLAEQNVPPKYLQERLGHKNLKVAMKYYVHLTEKMSEDGDDLISRIYDNNN